jgi:outer membrane protein TolC
MQALQTNLDITVSRQFKEARLSDIAFEQAKFDPTVNLTGRYDRNATPLNRPLFGLTSAALNEPRTFDQNQTLLGLGLTKKFVTGTNLDLKFAGDRTFVGGPNTFLFNSAYTSEFKLNVTQPLLRDFGIDVNKTLIHIAQKNAIVESHVFFDKVLTVIASVEQTYWELVFANENLKVVEDLFRAAKELVVSNRARAKAGHVADVEVLHAEAGVASRMEQVLLAQKAIKDQEDQLLNLLNPGEDVLLKDVQLVPTDQPVQLRESTSLERAKDTALERRPEVLHAQKNVEIGDLNSNYSKNQLLPNLSVQAILGTAGLGEGFSDTARRNYGGDFYNYGAGLVLSYPLGNQAATSLYNRRQLEMRAAEATLQMVRNKVIIGVKEAVRRVQTDFQRIETTQSARILAEKQLWAEQERFKAGLNTTIFLLIFQRDLAVARAGELRAVVDYNKSLSNLARQLATTLDKYNLAL